MSRGLARLRRGEIPGSIADFDAALAVNPRLPDTLYGRAIAKRRIGDVVGADADFAAAQAIRPGIAQEFALPEIE
jgi:Flp pilus assembly protein TadD